MSVVRSAEKPFCIPDKILLPVVQTTGIQFSI